MVFHYEDKSREGWEWEQATFQVGAGKITAENTFEFLLYWREAMGL
jgi:hypothetical protein